MSVDEKVSEEEKQQRSIFTQFLERTLANNTDWVHLYYGLILIGYTADNSGLPFLLPLCDYAMIVLRHKEVRALFTGEILVYFRGDKKPSFCSANNLYADILEQAFAKGLDTQETLMARLFKYEKDAKKESSDN